MLCLLSLLLLHTAILKKAVMKLGMMMKLPTRTSGQHRRNRIMHDSGLLLELIIDNLLNNRTKLPTRTIGQHKLLICFPLPQTHPKTTSLYCQNFGKPCSQRQCYFVMSLQSSVICLGVHGERKGVLISCNKI